MRVSVRIVGRGAERLQEKTLWDNCALLYNVN
jgi:hypothetical protein